MGSYLYSMLVILSNLTQRTSIRLSHQPKERKFWWKYGFSDKVSLDSLIFHSLFGFTASVKI